MSRRVGLILMLISLLLSVALFYFARRAETLSAAYEFREITTESAESIRSRVDSYGQVITGVAGFMGVTENVGLEEFNEYVGSLNLEQTHDGIRAVTFARAIATEETSALEREMSLQYGKETKIFPETDRDQRYVLTQLVPMEGNRSALGLDLSFDEGRRIALDAARDTGRLQMTPRLDLMIEGPERAGFFLAQAVFEREYDVVSGQTETGEFLGWVVAPFLVGEMMNGATYSMGRDFHLRVFDSTENTAASRIFDSGQTPDNTGAFMQEYTLNLYGQMWRMQFTSVPRFDRVVTSYLPHALMAMGLILTAFLGLAFKYLDLRNSALSRVADERKRELGAREDENRALLDTTLSAVMVLDDAGSITYANHAAQELFGAGPSGFDGREFGDLVMLKPGNQRKDGYNAEGRDAEGKLLRLDVETNSWKTAGGADRVTAIVRDVTEAIEARREVDAVRRRYDVALAGAEIGIFELDLTTGASVVSDTWHKIMGTTDVADDFDPQKHFLSRVHPEDLPVLQEADRRCIMGETHRTICEYRMRFGDAWRWMVSDAIATARGPNGHATGLIGTQTDITAIRHARNALEASEDRFRMVVEHAPVGMALMDESGRFQSVNAALADLCGYDTQTLTAQMGLADLLSEEDFARSTADVRVLLKQGVATTYESQVRIRTRSGNERWGLVKVNWTHDKNRGENVYIAQIVDITDQKKVEQIKSEFVATVSHELRTPLTSIKGALGLLEATERGNMAKSAARLMEIARTNTDRLTMIVNDILDLEKISSGEVLFEMENTSLDDIVTASVTELQPFASQHRNTLEIKAPQGEVVVHVDSNRTRQVLANLLSNACKYSDPDTPVTIRFERLGDEAIVFVQNFGPGIPEGFRERIFEAFTQADGSDTRSKGGTGLGLNITRQIVARQGGKIGFESVKDGLTVFWFTVPLVQVDAIVPRDETTQGAREARKALRVLHVEDDRDFADVIRAGVGDGAEFTHAPSIATARRQIGMGRWDVVLMDWILPDGDGSVLLDQIEADQPKSRVIVLTAGNGGGTDDPRVDMTLTKSQVEIDKIVQIIRRVGSDPTRSTRNFSG